MGLRLQSQATAPQVQRLLAVTLPAVVQQLRPALRAAKPGATDFDSVMGAWAVLSAVVLVLGHRRSTSDMPVTRDAARQHGGSRRC